MADIVNEKTTITPEKKGPFDIPTWAGKPPQGLHLDVMKSDKFVEKLIIDEKSCYLFGRNKDTCDFQLEHTSCSRVHAALVFHRHLKRCFLVDLGSTHGTFIGTIRLEKQKPTQVQVDSVIRFGASTRSYTLREKPTGSSKGDKENTDENEDINQTSLIGLPETDTELDDLTEFNTAHNKRLALVGLDESGSNLGPMAKLSRKRKQAHHVSFNDSEEVINPEDIDPSVGKFRNMVHTSVVVPTKKIRMSGAGSMTDSITKRLQSFPYSQGLYANLPHAGGDEPTSPTSPTSPTGSLPKLNITSAPDVDSPGVQHVDMIPEQFHPKTAAFIPTMQVEAPKKKKYAKEAWPGKKPTPSLLI